MHKAVERFLKRLPQKGSEKIQGAALPKPITQMVGQFPKKTSPIFRHIKESISEQRSVFWVFCAVILIWTAALFIHGVVYVLDSRSVQVSEAKITMREEHETSIEEIGVRRDHFDLFVVSTLNILMGVDDSGASYRPLLKGSVNPEILLRFEQETTANLSNIRKNMVVQNLTINTIREFAYNAETNVASAYVMGYVATIIQQTESGQRSGTLPFRAKVFVKNTSRNTLTPQGFYLVDMEDRIGIEALEWDKEVLK